MLRGIVDRRMKRCDLTGYAGNMDDRLGRGGLSLIAGGEKVRKGKLCGVNRVGEVDVETSIAG